MFNDINEPHKIKKHAILAIIAEGLSLSIINLLYITGLGPSFAAVASFPLLETLRLIRVGGFLERLDIIIIVTMVVAGFMKISFFMYFGALGISKIFNITRRRKLLAVILGILVFISSELIAKSFPEHLKIGLDTTVKLIHLPLQIILPLLALVVAWFKHRNKNKSSQTSN
jgi:spore germination protein KB